MSLSSALNAARSGLTTTQSLSRIAADNVSNAMTSGYTRRTALLVTPGNGRGGALVAEIRREVNLSLTRMARLEDAKMAQQRAVTEGMTGYSAFLGQPGDPTSMATKFTQFQTAFTTLANMPSSSEAQTGLSLAAEDLVSTIRSAGDTLNNTKAEVDMEIRYEVGDLNQALQDLAALNVRRQQFESGTLEAAEYEDQIDRVLDDISSVLDVRISRNSDGWVNVFTRSGAALIEGDLVQDITYSPGDGTLMAGSQDITFNKSGVRGVEHGSLAGLLELKREILPSFQLQLDDYARSLIETFETADASLTPGVAGLFTDAGSPLDPSDIEGLASRISLNPAAQYGSGELWKLRDGFGATAPGPASDGTQLQTFLTAMTQSANADPATGFGTQVTLQDYAAEVVSSQSQTRSRAEASFNAASSAAEVVRSARENGEGVNIDDEMQKLLLIEQSYAANSRILTTVSEMLDTLLAAV